MDYQEEILDNYQELAAKHPKAAAELLDKFGEGKWQEYALCWYPSEEEFAKFEVEEGWYRDVDLSDVELTQSSDFVKTPNLLDFINLPDLRNFIDFKSFGKALMETWDDPDKYETTDGEIVTSSWGF